MKKLFAITGMAVISILLLAWSISVISSNYILDVPQNHLVFKMGPSDGHLVKMGPGKHLVRDKLDYRVEPLASTGKINFTIEERDFLLQVAESGWKNYNNFRHGMSQ